MVCNVGKWLKTRVYTKKKRKNSTSPECFRHCWACAVSPYGPQATQHPDDVSIHRTGDLEGTWCHTAEPSTLTSHRAKKEPYSTLCLQLCLHGQEQWNLWLQQCSVPLQAVASVGSPPCRASFPAALTPPDTRQAQVLEPKHLTSANLDFITFLQQFRPSELLHGAFFLWSSSQVPPTSGLLPVRSRNQYILIKGGNAVVILCHLPFSGWLKGITSRVAAARSCTVGQRWKKREAEFYQHFDIQKSPAQQTQG